VVQLRLLMTGMWRLLQRNRAREELLALNATLEQRVAERTAAAESANRAKSQFLANMSHELRTPLNSVIGFANILLKNKAGNLRPEDLTFLDRILANGKHLLGLINQILDLAKVEARKVEVVKTSVALDRLVPDLLGQFESQVRGKPLKLQADLPRPMARLETDEGKLRQVLINLVGNAIKFTDRGSVTVRVAVDEATRQPVRIEVADTGIGIPPDRQAAVFEAFQQADASTTRRYGGTGLGLTICKALCELLGYRLELRSGVGQGSTFSLFLPAPAVPVPAGPPSPAEVPPPVPAPLVPAPPSAPAAREKLVLVIDDEADSRLLLTRLVEECGCRVVAVDSGDLALKMARELRPDLITLDLLMPRLDGWGVLKQLKDDPELRQIPVVVVSVVAAEHRGTVFGAVEVLPKPVAREDLLRVLQTRPRARLLLVEDNADDRRLVSAHLADRGVELRTAANGRLALEELQRFSPDVILLDLMMPEMDGLSFLDALRKDPRHWQVPVYVVTAKELTAAEQQRLARQTQAVLKKAEDWGGDLERLLNGLLKSPSAPARATAPAVEAQPAAKP
jgi:signal transduction histidine kinase/CheY-like chemotaxis protein